MALFEAHLTYSTPYPTPRSPSDCAPWGFIHVKAFGLAHASGVIPPIRQCHTAATRTRGLLPLYPQTTQPCGVQPPHVYATQPPHGPAACCRHPHTTQPSGVLPPHVNATRTRSVQSLYPHTTQPCVARYHAEGSRRVAARLSCVAVSHRRPSPPQGCVAGSTPKAWARPKALT